MHVPIILIAHQNFTPFDKLTLYSPNFLNAEEKKF